MRNLIFAFIVIIFVIIQISFLPNFFPEYQAPNLMLMVVIFWTARANFEKALGWSVFAGLVMDLFLMVPFGLNTLSFVLISFLSGSLAKRFLVSQKAWRFLATAGFVLIGIVINDFLIEMYTFLFQGGDNMFFDANLLAEIACSLLVFSIIYWPLRKIEKLFPFYDPTLKNKLYV